MFDNVVLDVFIGMTLLFLLYSLLVSIIGEMVSNWLGLRSRLLRKGMETMLNDPYDFPKLFSKTQELLASFFVYEHKMFKGSFAGKFYNQPSIKFLTSGTKEWWNIFKQSKPSYISKENFADTVLQMFRNKGIGRSDMEKISFAIRFNTLNINPETLKHFRNILEEAGTDMEAFRKRLFGWYDETNDRITGWYKRKLQFILFWLGFIIAASFNVDSVKIAKMLATDKNARAQMVEMGIKVADTGSPISKALQRSGDTATSDSLLKESYNDVKKAVDETNKVLGLGWDFDKRLKTKVVKLEMKPQSLDSLKKYYLIPAIRALVTIHAYKNLISTSKNKKTTALYKAGLKKELKNYASLSQQFTAITKEDFAPGRYISVNAENYRENALCVNFTGKQTLGIFDMICFVAVQSVPWKPGFWGFLITALMLSLGSNFWFDLLRKLVAIRSSGVKPEEKKVEETDGVSVAEPTRATPASTSPVSVSAQVPTNFIDAAINKYGDDIMKIPGVSSVFKGIKSVNNNTVDCLQINYHGDSNTLKALQSRFSNMRMEGILVDFEFVATGMPKIHLGNIGEISNKSGTNGSGSLGCILKSNESGNLHVLSCWHVMKGDNINYDATDNQVSISYTSASKIIGDRWGGGIQGGMDYGLALCKDASLFKNNFLIQQLELKKLSFRAVNDSDFSDHTGIRFFDIHSGKNATGIIYSSAPAVDIYYPDKVRQVKDLLILTNDLKPGSFEKISDPGNSGALIFDKDGYALGMIIAGDNKFTYAMKLSKFFELFPEMVIASDEKSA